MIVQHIYVAFFKKVLWVRVQEKADYYSPQKIPGAS